MEFSFIILTWNSEMYIERCVESIIREVRSLNEAFEIHIVDNGSGDSTPKRIRRLNQLHPGAIHPIFLKKNLGTTRSRNMALRKAKGRFFVILDSDIQLLKGVLKGLRQTFQNDDSIGLVAPLLIFPDGRYQKSVDIFPTVLHKIKRFFWLRKMESIEALNSFPTNPVEVDYAISAVWMLPRSIIHRVGFFDEKYFYSPEDVDYCLRVWMSGLSIVYNPFVAAIHHTQEISRVFKPNRAFISHVMGLFYYFFKHRYLLRKPIFNQFAGISNTIRHPAI